MPAAISSRATSASMNKNPWLVWFPLLMVASAGLGVGGTIWYLRSVQEPESLVSAPAGEGGSDAVSGQSEEESETPLAAGTVRLPIDAWSNSGVEVDAAVAQPFSRSIMVTGKIEINEDRLAHIYSMVEGSVDEVSVSLGDTVEANKPLAVIHSREVGTAKLELFQAQLAKESAENQERLTSQIVANTRELLEFLREGRPIQEVETTFRDKPMGDYRELALAAYSNYLKSQADLTRLETVGDSGAIAGRQILAAQANRNADLATFQSRIEQIAYDLDISLLQATQTLREASARVLIAETNLRILGCSEEELASINPAEQGESLSHYSIRAPFAGTILSKDVVLHEQVRPDVMLLKLADLSSVWVSVDIYEENVSRLAGLEGRSIQFTSNAIPDRVFEARVFHTGEIMDEATRTIALRATVDNPERLLKPGTFVTVHLPVSEAEQELTLPLSAIQEHEGRTFVFVHRGEGLFERRDVVLGETNGVQSVVVGGLESGESIAMRGGFVLKSLLLAELMGEE